MEINYSDAERRAVTETTNTCAMCLGVSFFPCTLLCSWFEVREQHEAVLLNFGQLTGVETRPGIHFRNCWGRTIKVVSKQKQSISLPPTKIVDKSGNPLMVSGIVVFFFEDSQKTAIDIQYPEAFVANAAHTSLKTVVGRYPYESEKPGQLCLKKSAKLVSQELTRVLQESVQAAGVRIISLDFNELSYAPEIAHGMLKRQQAQAMVAARSKIVSGATSIALDAVNALEQRGIEVKQHDRAKIITNLLTLISSESEAQPVIDVKAQTPHQPHY